jgi:isoleucyl-tRNA synthetase
VSCSTVLLLPLVLKMIFRQLSSSTEAEVDIIRPRIRNDLTNLITREGTSSRVCWSSSIHSLYLLESFLKTLFIVSDVSVTEEESLGKASLPWFYEGSLPLPGETIFPPQWCGLRGKPSGTDERARIRARPATLAKCPRCWTFTRLDKDALCARCTDVLSTSL